jgi:hypothetical protein
MLTFSLEIIANLIKNYAIILAGEWVICFMGKKTLVMRRCSTWQINV